MQKQNIHPDALELAGILEGHWSELVAHSELSKPGVLVAHVAQRSLEADAKTRIKNLEDELGAARDEKAEAQRDLDAASKAYAASKEPLSNSSPEFKRAYAARAKVGVADEKIAQLTAEQGEILRFLGGVGAPNGAQPFSAPPFAGPAWSTNALLQASADELYLAATTESLPVGRVDLGRVVDAQTLASQLGTMSQRGFVANPMVADVAGTDAMRRGSFYGVVPQLRRRLRVLDLIPTDTMDGQKVPYTRESGSFTTAAETAEGTTKPEAGVVYTDEEAAAKTIAHWQKVRKQSLADYAQMQQQIDTRLRYGVLLRLENQVLAGDGTGENLTGILQTSGIGAVAYDAGELPADQVLMGIVSVFLANGEATGIVMNPLDWAAALKAKASGDGHYYSNGPFSVTPETMWGVPLLSSAAIAQGHALVADFALAAQLFIREGVHVLISDSDQDDFVKNKVTLLGEMRAALAVLQPGVVVDVDLAA